MTEWEAKYKTLASGMHPEHIKSAELLVTLAHKMALTTRMTTSEALDALVYASRKQQQMRREIE